MQPGRTRTERGDKNQEEMKRKMEESPSVSIKRTPQQIKILRFFEIFEFGPSNSKFHCTFNEGSMLWSFEQQLFKLMSEGSSKCLNV